MSAVFACGLASTGDTGAGGGDSSLADDNRRCFLRCGLEGVGSCSGESALRFALLVGGFGFICDRPTKNQKIRPLVLDGCWRVQSK